MTRKRNPATESLTEQSSSTPSTKTKTSNLSATDPGFREAALENGILGIIESTKNNNLTLMQTRLGESRNSPSPSKSEFEWYSKTVEMVDCEDTLIERTKSKLLKEYDDKEIFYSRVTNQAFSAFPKSVGFNNKLSPAKPDMAEGFRLPEWRPYQVRKELGGSAVPFKGLYAIVLPQIAGEWKAPGKDMVLAKIQAAYDGAHMVYGRNKALESIGKSDDPGHAFVTTFITDGTIFEAYAHYATESKGKVEYHMCRITSLHMTSSHESYVTSRRALRNLQDFAKEQSEKLRDLLKLTWEKSQQSGEGKPSKRTYNNCKSAEGSDKGNGNNIESLAKIPTPEDISSSSPSKFLSQEP